VEIPTHPREGVDLGALEQALEKHNNIRACWFMPTFQNPLGATMPDEKKRDLVQLLEKRSVPLIEDDVYAELYFGHERPRPAKAFDTKGIVLSCGSFSKCLAPGYRLGWVAAGQFAQSIQRRKMTTSLATSVPVQEGIALLMRQDGYDGHLGKLRRTLAAQQASALRSLQKHLPDGYRVTQPEGGYFLWVELPAGVDSLEVHRQLLDRDISIAPGPIFSPRREFQSCVRINCGHPWTAGLDQAIATLGRVVQESAA
jgi:DNA-binding transcriptional MocR family regulator